MITSKLHFISRLGHRGSKLLLYSPRHEVWVTGFVTATYSYSCF